MLSIDRQDVGSCDETMGHHPHPRERPLPSDQTRLLDHIESTPFQPAMDLGDGATGSTDSINRHSCVHKFIQEILVMTPKI